MTNVISHENVHQQIALHDGCENVTKEINYVYLKGFVRCEDPGYVESDVARLSHNYNEIIGYNIDSLIALIIVSIIFLALIQKRGRDL